MTKQELGDIALEIIAGHPLYASTSGVTYDEAIAIAKVIAGPDLVAYKKEMDRIDNLSVEELRAEIEGEKNETN